MNKTRPDGDEYNKGEYHAEEGHQESDGEADVLLDIRHAQVLHERSGIDEPVKPISNPKIVKFN